MKSIRQCGESLKTDFAENTEGILSEKVKTALQDQYSICLLALEGLCSVNLLAAKVNGQTPWPANANSQSYKEDYL